MFKFSRFLLAVALFNSAHQASALPEVKVRLEIGSGLKSAAAQLAIAGALYAGYRSYNWYQDNYAYRDIKNSNGSSFLRLYNSGKLEEHVINRDRSTRIVHRYFNVCRVYWQDNTKYQITYHNNASGSSYAEELSLDALTLAMIFTGLKLKDLSDDYYSYTQLASPNGWLFLRVFKKAHKVEVYSKFLGLNCFPEMIIRHLHAIDGRWIDNNRILITDKHGLEQVFKINRGEKCLELQRSC